MTYLLFFLPALTMYLYNEGGANLPASSLQYKRAVYKQPPKQFTVDFLLPQKQGKAEIVTICPLILVLTSS